MKHTNWWRRVISWFPKLEYLLRLVKWRFVNTLRRTYVRYLQPKRVLGDPFQVEYVSPDWIRYKAYAPKHIKKPAEVTSVVLDGDWDTDVSLVSDFEIVKAVKARFQNNKRWEETEYYAAMKRELLKGDAPYGMKNTDDLNKHLHDIDVLFDTMGSTPFSRTVELRY